MRGARGALPRRPAPGTRLHPGRTPPGRGPWREGRVNRTGVRLNRSALLASAALLGAGSAGAAVFERAQCGLFPLRACSSRRLRRATTASDRAHPGVDSSDWEALQLEQGLTRLREFVETEQVEAARGLAPLLLERWPADQRLRRSIRVLAPPVAAVTRRRGEFSSGDLERRWLREHRHEYPGCWMAVKGDLLIAADPCLARVLARVREVTGGHGADLCFQPGTAD